MPPIWLIVFQALKLSNLARGTICRLNKCVSCTMQSIIMRGYAIYWTPQQLSESMHWIALYSSLKADKVFSLATITILTTGLEIIWPNRQQKKTTTLFMVRAELECAVSISRRSRNCVYNRGRKHYHHYYY